MSADTSSQTAGIPGWLKRLVEEYEELKLRHDKLKTFVSSDAINDLDPANQELLIAQEEIMQYYAQILLTRISLATVK